MRFSKALTFGAAITGAGAIAAMRRSRLAPLPSSSPTVWMINHYANPPELPGGTRHHELAKLLKLDQWNPVIFASAYSHRTMSNAKPVSAFRPVHEQDENGVPFVWLYTTPYEGNGSARYANMASFLVTVLIAGLRRNRPDVVIGSSPHLLAAFGGWLLARYHRVPFILEIRDLWPESLIQLGFSNPVALKPL